MYRQIDGEISSPPFQNNVSHYSSCFIKDWTIAILILEYFYLYGNLKLRSWKSECLTLKFESCKSIKRELLKKRVKKNKAGQYNVSGQEDIIEWMRHSQALAAEEYEMKSTHITSFHLFLSSNSLSRVKVFLAPRIFF